MDGILEFLKTTLSDILRNVINTITLPLMNIIRYFIPEFSSYFSHVNNFINTYIFKGVQFVKMTFLNLTNINHTVFNLLVISFVIVLNLTIFIITFKLVYNLWQIFRGTKKGDS